MTEFKAATVFAVAIAAFLVLSGCSGSSGASLSASQGSDAVFVTSSAKRYDSDGNLISESQFERDERGNLVKLTTTDYSSEEATTTERSYENDSNGNVTTQSYVKDGEELSFTAFKNELNDLGLAVRSTDVESENFVIEWDYDDSGKLRHFSESLNGKKESERTIDEAGFELTRVKLIHGTRIDGLDTDDSENPEYETFNTTWTKDESGFPTHLTITKETTNESDASIIDWEIETDSFGAITRERNLNTGEYIEYINEKVSNPSPYIYANRRIYNAIISEEASESSSKRKTSSAQTIADIGGIIPRSDFSEGVAWVYAGREKSTGLFQIDKDGSILFDSRKVVGKTAGISNSGGFPIAYDSESERYIYSTVPDSYHNGTALVHVFFSDVKDRSTTAEERGNAIIDKDGNIIWSTEKDGWEEGARLFGDDVVVAARGQSLGRGLRWESWTKTILCC